MRLCPDIVNHQTTICQCNHDYNVRRILQRTCMCLSTETKISTAVLLTVCIPLSYLKCSGNVDLIYLRSKMLCYVLCHVPNITSVFTWFILSRSFVLIHSEDANISSRSFTSNSIEFEIRSKNIM